MMWTNSSFMPIGMHIHALFMVTLLLGVVFLTIYAIKFIDKKTLKNWVIGLLVVGVIGTLLTCSWGAYGMKGMMGDYRGTPMFQEHMEDDEHSSITSPEEMREHMLEEMEEHME